MLVALDLTARQAARVLAEAIHKHAKLEIEPRTACEGDSLWGVVTARGPDTLSVEILGTPGPNLESLAGVMCDVRTILSKQLYLFSTVILEASGRAAPARLTLAAPAAVQVANRRRHARKIAGEAIAVRLDCPTMSEACLAPLWNLGIGGLACRVPRRVADEHLLIGDVLRIEFVLPWVNRTFSLPATICSKSADADGDHLLVGFEFRAAEDADRAALAVLRDAVQRETQRLTEMEGA